MAYVFLVLGLALTLVVWDLGRRLTKQRAGDDRIASLEDEVAGNRRALEHQILELTRSVNGRAPSRLAAFGPVRK